MSTLSEYEYEKVSTKEKINEKEEIPPHYGYGIRHIQLIIFCACVTTNFIARGHLGVTIVAMTSHKDDGIVINVNQTVQSILDDRNISDMIGLNNVTVELGTLDIMDNETFVTTEAEKAMKFEWPKSTQEIVLGSFFLGYFIMTFPAGILTQRFGAKIPFQISLIVNGLLSFATPWLTYWGGWKAITVCRVMQGFAQAGVFPSTQMVLSKWASKNERGSLTGYIYAGVTTGTVIAFQLSGFLSASRWGWPSAFWAVGVICMACCAILTVFGAASPLQHKTISEEEKKYIIGNNNEETVKRPPPPFKKIITSGPMWANFITHIGSGAVFVFYFTQMPSYIHYIIGVNVKSSGLLSSLPYLFSIFTSIVFGMLSDLLTNKKIMSIKNSRRISNSIGQVGMGLSMLVVSYTTNAAVAVTCLVIAMGCHSGIHTGWMVNHIDLAPNFTAAMVAIGNTMLNTVNILLPILVSHVITDMSNVIQWRIMFFVIAGISFMTNAIFVIFMSSEIQPWNTVEVSDSTLKEQESMKNIEK